MKTIVLVFSICLISLTGLKAQITVDQNDMPAPGDSVVISSGLNLDFIDFKETGEDFYWDFSEVTRVSQRVINFVEVGQTPIFYWPFFLFSANMASPVIEDSILPGLPLSDVYEFFNNNTDNYRYEGFAATLSGFPLPIKYEDPDILYKFPMNYGNVDSSESGLAFGLPDVAYILIDKKRKNTVDGWGTLETPYGIFDVLRVKSEISEYDSIYIDSLQIGIPLNREYVEYKWLGKDRGLPLFTVTDDLFGLVVEYIDSVDNGPSAVPAGQFAGMSVRVYPNPTNDKLNIQLDRITDEEVTIFMLDHFGKIIYEKRIARLDKASTISVDLKGMNCAQGQYNLVIKTASTTLVRKIIFTR